MMELLQKIVIGALSLYALWKVGPPVVDQYFLPTIECVAHTFHAIAAQPPPLTSFTPLQTPIAAEHAATTSKTVFVMQAGWTSQPEGATITGVSHGQRSEMGNDDGPFWNFFFSFGWCFRLISEASHTILLQLRQLLINFLYQVKLFAATFVIWNLLKHRNQMNIEYITAVHEREILGIQQESSALALARDLEIASLKAENESQKLELDSQTALLDEARREIEKKTLVEGQSESELAKLRSSLTDRDNTIAELDDSLAEVTTRAETAESSNKTLELRARKTRSDFDSTLQKKDNDINTHKRASEQAIKDGETARRELKEARAQSSKDKKWIIELEKQLSNSSKKVAELEAQAKENDASIGRKDGAMTSLRDEKQKLAKKVEKVTVERDRALRDGRTAKAKDKKLIGELHEQLTEANNLRQVAEAEAAEQKDQVTEATEQRKVAENKMASVKADAGSSISYIQRRLDAATASNEKMHTALTNERAEARDAAAKAKETEAALSERIAQLEEQLREKSVPSTRPGPRCVPPPNGKTNTPPEERGLPANTPTGPKERGLPANTPTGPKEKGLPANTLTGPKEKGLPANTPTGPKAGRGGKKN